MGHLVNAHLKEHKQSICFFTVAEMAYRVPLLASTSRCEERGAKQIPLLPLQPLSHLIRPDDFFQKSLATERGSLPLPKFSTLMPT